MGLTINLPESGWRALRTDILADELLCYLAGIPDALLPDDDAALEAVAQRLAEGACDQAEARGVDAGELWAALAAKEDGPACLVCGCTEFAACADDGSGAPCHWVSLHPPLCSACEGVAAAARNGFALIEGRR